MHTCGINKLQFPSVMSQMSVTPFYFAREFPQAKRQQSVDHACFPSSPQVCCGCLHLPTLCARIWSVVSLYCRPPAHACIVVPPPSSLDSGLSSAHVLTHSCANIAPVSMLMWQRQSMVTATCPSPSDRISSEACLCPPAAPSSSSTSS